MSYNLLTEKLIAEGYDVNNHPTYVEAKEGTLDNFQGGFTYVRGHLYDKTFKTPCGLLCKFDTTFDNLFYNGVEYTYENDLAIVHCPKGCKMCAMRHEGMRDMSGAGNSFCAVSMTDEPYEYKGSIEELNDIKDKRKAAEKEEYLSTHTACANHMRYVDDHWEYHYDPEWCKDCGSIANGTCPLYKQDKEKGNVFYDLVIRHGRPDLAGSLFDGQIDTEIIKGKQYFTSPVNMTICKIFAVTGANRILQREKGRYSRELFFAEYHPSAGNFFEVSIRNIRAEKRETRDLEQDLADMAAGIRVSHHRDDIKAEKKRKKEIASERLKKRQSSLRRKLVKVGYGSLKDYSSDKRNADKWFDKMELTVIEREHKAYVKEHSVKQISLFDILQGE